MLLYIDKPKVAKILHQLISARLAYCRLGMGSGTILGYRGLMAMSAWLLDSLETPEKYRGFEGTKVIKDVRVFMRLYRFRSLDEGKDSGYTPLRFATMHAKGMCTEYVKRDPHSYSVYERLIHQMISTRLVKKMIAQGASIKVPLSRTSQTFPFLKGQDLLMTAFAMCGPEMIRTLLDAGANPWGVSGGVTAMDSGLRLADCSDNMNVVLEYVKEKSTKGEMAKPLALLNRKGVLGFDLYQVASTYGRLEACRLLHERWGANILGVNYADRNALQLSTLSCDPSVTKYLLSLLDDQGEKIFPVNRRNQWSRMSEFV